MNSKQLKFYQLFAKLCQTPNLGANTIELSANISALLDLDYILCQDVWEYLCVTFEPSMLANTAVAQNIGQAIFDQFYKKSQAKCVKTIYDIPPIRRAVFMYNPLCGSGAAFQILVDTLVVNKVECAEELLKCLIKNTRADFGAVLIQALERVFIELLKKSQTKKIELSKKLNSTLLCYIAKIKTDARPILEQRLKEIT